MTGIWPVEHLLQLSRWFNSWGRTYSV